MNKLVRRVVQGLNLRSRNRADKQHAWTLGLRHPLEPRRRLAELHLRDRALGTAGGATQFFAHGDRRFSHIIDPRTGWPVEGIYTATVIAPTAAEADALATAFYVMGVEEAAHYCAKHPEIGTLLVCPTTDPAGVALHAFGLRSADWSCFDGV